MISSPHIAVFPIYSLYSISFHKSSYLYPYKKDIITESRGGLFVTKTFHLPNNKKAILICRIRSRGISPPVNKFAKEIEAANIPKLKWTYSDEPNEKHSTIFRATKVRTIVWSLGDQELNF